MFLIIRFTFKLIYTGTQSETYQNLPQASVSELAFLVIKVLKKKKSNLVFHLMSKQCLKSAGAIRALPLWQHRYLFLAMMMPKDSQPVYISTSHTVKYSCW